MRILILNGSPAGKDSITLFTAQYIESRFPAHSFETLHVGQRIRAIEKDFAPCREALERADLILFCYPVYTFLAPAQLHRFIELMKASGVDFTGKWATQLTTSKHFYDVTAHRFIQDNCEDMGLCYVRGLSADMDDLLSEKGRAQALDFFRFTLQSMERGWQEPALRRASQSAPLRLADAAADAYEVPSPKRVVIVSDLPEDSADPAHARLRAMRDRLAARLGNAEVAVMDVSAFPFAGGCLGCFHCAADGQCVYRDGFDRWLRENIQTADAIIYAYVIRDHSMGSRFKLFDDRQFCNGHRTVTMGKPVGYLVDGHLDDEPNLRMLMESRAQVGGNFLAGVATDQADPNAEVDRLAGTLLWSLEHDYQPPQNFFGVGGLKIFRDLIYQMRGMMRADHKFYKAHGFYDFPQKRRGRIAAMYLVGAMMNNKKLWGKLGGKMTEGMTMPYRKVLEKEADQPDKRS